MNKYILGLAVVSALSILSGCSSATHKNLANNSTTQDIGTVKKMRAHLKLDPRGSNAISSETFIDPSYGWIVVGHQILATTNGGRTWSKVSEVSDAIGNIGFVSKKHGWLFTGEDLKITEDGGKTWHDESIPDVSGIKLEQAQFVDKKHGWIMGTGEGAFIPDPNTPGSGKIPSIIVFWSTTDGGKTWLRMNVPTKIANNEFEGNCYFSFISPEQGFLLMGTQPGTGAQGKSLYRTIDGGRHWTKVTSIGFYASEPKNGLPGGGYITGLDFLNAKVGWLSEDRGPIFFTMDGGQIWKALGYHDMRELHFLDSKHGYAIYRNVLLTTEDGGATWKQTYPGLWPSLFTSSRFFNSRDGISAGTLVAPRAILRTKDGGFTWRQIASIPGNGRLLAFSFPDSQHGWVITEEFNGSMGNPIQRIIYRTTDGGMTWKKVASTREQKNLYASISFVNTRTGFIASGWGHLFVTHDGGKTLKTVDSNDSGSSDIQFLNSSYGWKIMNHHLYTTNDAGQNWHRVPLNYMVVNFDLVNRDTVWVIANSEFNSPSATTGSPQFIDQDHPVLLSSSDGGHLWTLHDLGNIHPAGVVFANSEHGWLVDDYNHYYHTDDGGQTWIQVNLLTW